MGEVLRNGAIIGAILGTLCSMPLTSFTPENSGRSTIRLLPMFVCNGLICAGMGAAVVAILLAFSWTVLATLIDLADGIAQSAKSLWSSQDIEQATSAGSQLPKPMMQTAQLSKSTLRAIDSISARAHCRMDLPKGDGLLRKRRKSSMSLMRPE